jgi:hypothetical protein
MIVAIITLLAALSIAIGAAYYSIVGLMAIFSGAALAVAIVAGTMEFGKIASVIWLHKHWDNVSKTFRTILSAQVVVLMLITSMGIFGFLSKAYLEQSGNQQLITLQIERQEQALAKLSVRRSKASSLSSQLDDSVDRYIELGYVTRGLEQMENQKESREQLKAEIDAIDREEANILDELQKLRTEKTAVELEVGPAKYIAELIYGESAEDNLDNAVRWVIMLLIFVFDPLAVTLLIAAQISFEKRNKPVDIDNTDQVELTNDAKVNVDLLLDEYKSNVDNGFVEPEEVSFDVHKIRKPEEKTWSSAIARKKLKLRRLGNKV